MFQTSISTNKLARQIEVISLVWHESGHALLALLYYFKVLHITITYTQEVEGTTSYLSLERVDLPDDIKIAIASNEIKLLYAGMVAEQLYYKEICGSSKLPSALRDGWQNDIKQVSNIIQRYDLAAPGKKRQDLKNQAKKDAAQMMTEHWDDLKLLSHALYKKKRLTFDDLKKLLTKKSENKDFWKLRFREIDTLFQDGIDNKEIAGYIRR
jgi:ATP-dependent Zn protease